MKALVTGGAGFIGSHLVEYLLSQGAEVIVYDSQESGNLEKVRSQIEYIQADIRDYETLKYSMEGCDRIFHLAAFVSVPQSIEQPQLAWDINTTGTLNVLQAALQNSISRVILASSCAVYGDSAEIPIPETASPEPVNPYGMSKQGLELIAEHFYRTYGLETVCLRVFNAYGPRQKADSDNAAVIPRFITCYREKTPPTIYGDGQQKRDFIHVSDVAQANFLAAVAPSEKILEHRVFNIGTGTATGILQLLGILSQVSEVWLEPEFKPRRGGDIQDSAGDCTLAQEKLGFQAIKDIKTGLTELWES